MASLLINEASATFNTAAFSKSSIARIADQRSESIVFCENCFVSSKFGPLMIFLKRWFGYTKTTFGGMHEYQEEAIA
jgi:hypothetical protein